jgi:hypothetical protein
MVSCRGDAKPGEVEEFYAAAREVKPEGGCSTAEFLPHPDSAKHDTRVNDPEFSWRAAQARVRRERIAPDGKLNILAADHPARRVTKVGDDSLAMANRHDYLARILRVLLSERVDGIMATMDLLEDLLSIDGFLRGG